MSKARYVIDNQSAVNISKLYENEVWNISELDSDEEIKIENAKADKLSIPFYGFVTKNRSGNLYRMDISDPLIKYGTRTVVLDRIITFLSPEPETKTTGYSLILAPEDIKQSVLNQLPILPDSIKISVKAQITDTPWSDIRLKYDASFLDNKSFGREIKIERSVMIKIAPFGWTPVNRVAPMIDWDKSFLVNQRFFIAPELNIPYGILEQRKDHVNIAVLDFKGSSAAIKPITGAPEIRAIPNPVINDVRFEISNVSQGSYFIKIKNILGEVKVKKEIQFLGSDAYPVNIDLLGKGSYFYVLEDDTGNVLSTKRLIVLKP